MLALFSILCTNPEYAKTYPFEVVKWKKGPCAIALNCGVYQLYGAEFGVMDLELGKMLMKGLLEQQGTDEELRWISPTFHVTADFPPAYIMTANDDQTVNAQQAALLIERLKELGVSYTAKEYGTKEAPLGHVFHCNIQLDEATACNDDECEFFRKYC